jgi:5'-nucleotidase
MVAALNAAGLDVAVLGNHEFDVGEAAFRAHLAQARFAVLGANVLDSAGRPFPGLRPHLVLTRTVGGRPVRVGFVGVVIPSNRPAWARLADPLEAARRAARGLRDSADVLVALTHLGVADDAQLAALAPEFDLVLGGHEHENYTLRRGPRLTPVLKADANARTAQVVTVTPTLGARPGVASRLQPVTAALADDPATARVVAAYTDSAFAGFAALGFAPRALVATLPEPLDGREGTVREGPAPLTALIGAGMRREAPGAAVWLLNAGSIRLDDVVPAGPLTEYDVIRILPFGGPVVRAELRGALLRRVLDQGARNAGTGGYLASNAERGPGGAWTVGGRPVADTAWYPAVLTDYLLTGQEAGLGFLTRESPDVRGAAPGRDVRRGFIDELRARHGRAAGAAGAAR